MVLSINSDSMDAGQMISQMKKIFLKNFTESYNKTDTEKEKQLDNKIKSLMETADKDKSGGLSKEELSSIDTKDNPDQENLVRDLLNGFGTYDTNNDNELSVKELKEALKKLNKQYSQQDIAKMAKENEEFKNSEKYAVSSSNFSSALADKIINNYDSISTFKTSSSGLIVS